MNIQRGELLNELLLELAADNGYVADQAFHAYHKAVAQAYVEVLVFRKTEGGYEFYLTKREAGDLDFPGEPWHIPGGVWRTTQTIEEGCAKIGMRELKIPVRFVAEAMTSKWFGLTHKHDGAETPRYPISHVCVCAVNQEVPVEANGQWFTTIPDNMIVGHIPFIRQALLDLTVGRKPIQL